jgi:hypothetical protein
MLCAQYLPGFIRMHVNTRQCLTQYQAKAHQCQPLYPKYYRLSLSSTPISMTTSDPYARNYQPLSLSKAPYTPMVVIEHDQ